jgi:hypothetical protein
MSRRAELLKEYKELCEKRDNMSTYMRELQKEINGVNLESMLKLIGKVYRDKKDSSIFIITGINDQGLLSPLLSVLVVNPKADFDIGLVYETTISIGRWYDTCENPVDYINQFYEEVTEEELYESCTQLIKDKIAKAR